jgi:hypothetical protein
MNAILIRGQFEISGRCNWIKGNASTFKEAEALEELTPPIILISGQFGIASRSKKIDSSS